MKPDPTVAAEMHRRAEMHKSEENLKSKDPMLFIYKEVRTIRRWIAFIGIVLIIGIIGAFLAVFS